MLGQGGDFWEGLRDRNLFRSTKTKNDLVQLLESEQIASFRPHTEIDNKYAVDSEEL